MGLFSSKVNRSSPSYEEVSFPELNQVTQLKTVPETVEVYISKSGPSQVDLKYLEKEIALIMEIIGNSDFGYITYKYHSRKYGESWFYLPFHHPEYETIYNMIEVNKFYVVSTYNKYLVSIEPDVTFVVGKVKSLIKMKDTDVSLADYHEIIFEDHPVRHHNIDTIIRLLVHTDNIEKMKVLQGSRVKLTAKRFKSGRYLVEAFEKI